MSEEEKSKYLQWFAGFYEGEGYITNDISNNNRIRLGIAQNDKSPLELAQKFWGGYISTRIRTTITGKISEGYEWRIGDSLAKVFIDDIKPFMIIPYKINQMNTEIEKSKIKLDRRFTCKFCISDFASPSGRRRHEKTFHLNLDASNSNELQDNQIAGNP